MNFDIKTIPHDKQRYATLGDWFPVKLAYQPLGTEATERAMIRVSSLDDERYEFLIAFHEMVEMMLCRSRKITAARVDEFDRNFLGDGEPGDDPSAPYFREHQFAMMLEKLLAHEMGIDWKEYSDRCEQCFNSV